MSGPASRALAILHEVAIAGTLLTAFAMGALTWVPLVAALDPAVSVWDGPLHGLRGGVAWTWPLGTLLIGLAAARIRAPLRRFVAMVLVWRNVLPGAVVGIAGSLLARLVLGAAMSTVLDPARTRFAPLPMVGFVAAVSGFVWLAGAITVREAPASGRTLRATLAAGWAVTWRVTGMLVVLGLAGLGYVAALLWLAMLPGFALLDALRQHDGFVFDAWGAAGAFRQLSVVLAVASSFGAALAVFGFGLVVPGHVFWRVVGEIRARAAVPALGVAFDTPPPTPAAEPIPARSVAERPADRPPA